MLKERAKAFCLYHLPDNNIPPANEKCKTCLEDYDPSHHPNNYDCPNFFAYPTIRYKDIREILDQRGIRLNNKLETQIMKKIETINRTIIIKHLARKDRKIKIDYEKITDQILQHLGVLNFIS